MGGEKRPSSRGRRVLRGSPPRGRGKGVLVAWVQSEAGITPAWAGKSGTVCLLMLLRWDHPRVGGEKISPNPSMVISSGSPPRGRGKDPDKEYKTSRFRITPAWAGKSPQAQILRDKFRDHPRVGGEKGSKDGWNTDGTGSPPRGRGKVEEDDSFEGALGITPAWAGKRLKRSHRSGIFISGPIPFHSVLHRPAGSGGSRAGRDGSPAGQPQNAGPA